MYTYLHENRERERERRTVLRTRVPHSVSMSADADAWTPWFRRTVSTTCFSASGLGFGVWDLQFAVSSHRMYLSIGFRKSNSPQKMSTYGLS